MSSGNEMERVEVLENIGSVVFESAVAVMGLPEQLSRSLLRTVLNALSIPEEDLQIEVLGLVMPQVDCRLRTYLSATETSEVMSRLQNLILGWDAALQ